MTLYHLSYIHHHEEGQKIHEDQLEVSQVLHYLDDYEQRQVIEQAL